MDPQNAHKLMKQVLDKSQMKELYTRLGSLAIFNPRNPTGYYRLQLSQQAQFTVARRLLEMFQVRVNISTRRDESRDILSFICIVAE